MLKMAEENLSRNAPNARFKDRVRRLVWPEELRSDEEQPWENGRGTEVWEMLTAAIRGDLDAIQQLAAKDLRLVTCSYQSRKPPALCSAGEPGRCREVPVGTGG